MVDILPHYIKVPGLHTPVFLYNKTTTLTTVSKLTLEVPDRYLHKEDKTISILVKLNIMLRYRSSQDCIFELQSKKSISKDKIFLIFCMNITEKNFKGRWHLP